MRAQSFPQRINIARPQERGVALHSRMSVAVQRERTLVRSIDLRPFVIHSIARQPRSRVQWIAFVWPPSVHTERKIFSMRVPVTRHFFFVESRQIANIARRAVQR